MDKVAKYTKELAAAICDSQPYAEFEAVKEEIRQNPDLREQVNQFRRKNYELQNSKDEIEWFEAVEQFERENEEFRKNPLVAEYLRKELEMCRILQRINKAIVGAVNLDIDDFADAIRW